MNTFTIKKYTASRFLGLLCSIAYGFFVVASLQRLYFSGSGDIAALLDFLEKYSDINFLTNNYSVTSGDGLFRLLVAFLGNLFNAEAVTVLSAIAFTISSITFYIFTINIRSKKYLLYLLPLFLMVFFTPNVANLYASSIRSGIAFTILLIAFIYPNVAIRSILFGLSAVIHLSMVPLISFYFLFHILRDRRINASSQSCYFLLTLYSFSVATVA